MELERGLSEALKKIDTSPTKEEILKAAVHLFAARGINGTTTRDIAARAGVNIAALHYHWGSKDQLAQAVFQRMIDEVVSVTEKILQEPVTELGKAIPKHLGQLYDFFIENPAYPRILLYGNLENPEHLELLRRRYILPLIKRASEWLRILMRLGKVRKIDPEVALLSLYGLLLVPFADIACQKDLLGEAIPDKKVATKFKQQFIDMVLTTFGIGKKTTKRKL